MLKGDEQMPGDLSRPVEPKPGACRADAIDILAAGLVSLLLRPAGPPQADFCTRSERRLQAAYTGGPWSTLRLCGKVCSAGRSSFE